MDIHDYLYAGFIGLISIVPLAFIITFIRILIAGIKFKLQNRGG